MSNEFKVKGNYLTFSYIKKFSLILFTLLFIFTISNLHATGKKLWGYHPGNGFVDTSPAVSDLDGDGVKDLVFCTVTGRVLALNSLGLRIWYHDVKEPISTPPVIADLNNDGALEVLVLTNNGNVICLDGLSGKFLWHYQLPSSITWGTTSLAISDLLNNGKNEIVAADNAGNLVCLKEDGNVQWSKKFKDKFNTAPAIGQLTEKGKKNILIGSDLSSLICLSPNGKELWRVNGEKSSGSGPLIADIDGDNIPEILVGTGKEFTLFNNVGKKLWSYKMRGDIHDAISFGDLYGDHKMEIIVADLIGDVVTLSNTGKALWTSNITQRVRRSATIADIDGDSKPEVLVAGYSSVLYVYNSDGSLKDQIPLKGPMNGSPTVVDFRNDGNLTVVCGANSEIMAFNWPNQNHNSNYIIPFAEYRGNSLRTGGILKENNTIAKANMEVNFGDVFVGDNTFKVIVHNPGKKHLDLKLKINKNDIANEGEISSSDTLFSEEVNYTISGTNALNFKFSSILSENGKPIIQKERSFYIVPFAKDIADLKDKLAAVQSLNSDNHGSNQYVSDQLIVFSHRLHEIEEKISVAGTLPLLELSELRNSVSLLRKAITIFYKMNLASQDAANGFAAYSANPWAPFGGVDEIVENRIPKAQVSIEAFMGETQSAAINIANFEGQSLTFRIEPLSLVSEKDSTKVMAKDVYELHEVLDVPTQAMDYSADALP
ncbi:MAG: PQQ-binding-like beta-propeller repeat protein, partial [Bacteroidota bacterium]|nr:PQQ-binding-like beta-propeller repeat protein [Bacteroidota bacterium]